MYASEQYLSDADSTDDDDDAVVDGTKCNFLCILDPFLIINLKGGWFAVYSHTIEDKFNPIIFISLC